MWMRHPPSRKARPLSSNMYKKLILSFIGFSSAVFLTMGLVANAAPTSTVVQNLFITGLAGGGTECLHILNSGLVQVTSGQDCGSGGPGGGGGITTSSAGSYTPGNIFLVVNSSTATADNNLNWSTSTQTLTALNLADVKEISGDGIHVLTVNGNGNDAQIESGIGGLIDVGYNSGDILFSPANAQGTLFEDPNTGNFASLDTSLLESNVNVKFPNASGTICLTSTCPSGITTTTPFTVGNIALASGTAIYTYSGSTCPSGVQIGVSASGTALCVSTSSLVNDVITLNNLSGNVIATGTVNQIQVSSSSGQLVFSIAANYSPSTTIPTTYVTALNFTSSTAIANTQILVGTAYNTFGSYSTLTYASGSNNLSVGTGTFTNVSGTQANFANYLTAGTGTFTGTSSFQAISFTNGSGTNGTFLNSLTFGTGTALGTSSFKAISYTNASGTNETVLNALTAGTGTFLGTSSFQAISFTNGSGTNGTFLNSLTFGTGTALGTSSFKAISWTNSSGTNETVLNALTVGTGTFLGTSSLQNFSFVNASGTGNINLLGYLTIMGQTTFTNATGASATSSLSAASGSFQNLYVFGNVFDSTGNKYVTSTSGSGNVTWLANGSSFITTSTIGFTAGSNISISTSSNGTYTFTATAGTGIAGAGTTTQVAVFLTSSTLYSDSGLTYQTGTQPFIFDVQTSGGADVFSVSSTYASTTSLCLGGTCNSTWPAGGSSVQLPVITVSTQSGANYASSSLIAAVTACSNATTYPNGANIYLPDATYVVTTTIKLASGCSLIGNPNYTTIDFSATSTGNLNSPGSALIAASGTSADYNSIQNLILQDTTSTYGGTALNLSNMGHAYINNVKSLQFRYAIYMNDTQNATFYNNITNWVSFDDNGVYMSSTNPTNENTFFNFTSAANQSNTTSSKFCYYINNGQSNKFYSPDCEPANATGTYGIVLQSQNAIDNQFYGAYDEAAWNPVVVSSTPTAPQRNQFYGGQFLQSSPGSRAFADNGFDTLFMGSDNNSVDSLFQYPITPSSTFKDNSNASQGMTFQNNTVYAHTGGTPLVSMKMVNNTDSDTLLDLNNAGTGKALNVSAGGISITGSSTFQGSIVSTSTNLDSVGVCGTSPTIIGTAGIGTVTTGSNASSTCTVTFNPPFKNTPTCTITSELNATSSLYITKSASTLIIHSVVSTTAMKSNPIDYTCIGH